MIKIKTKICTKCKIEKALKEFRKSKYGPFGVTAECKICLNVRNKTYYETNKKRISACQKTDYKANKSKFVFRNKIYYESHKKKSKIQCKAYREMHKGERKIYDEAYRRKNKKRRKAYDDTHRIRINICQSKRRKADPAFKLNCCISNAIRISLKGNKAGKHWELLVGYTLEKLKKHLEKQFINGMIWENYGKEGWEIDHIIPISVFNFTKSEHSDFKKCWALKNLQPLWAKENVVKSNKLTKHFQPSLLI